MALTGNTGNGATATLPGSFSVALITIEPGESSLEPVDVSTLATTTDMENIPGDLVSHAEINFTWKWVATVARPTLGTVGTITLTGPLEGALTNAPTYSGTGFLTKWKPPRMENGVLMVGEGSAKFDGDTGPTFTVAS